MSSEATSSEAKTTGLEARINTDVIVAMKARDSERTSTLRMAKSALKMKSIEKRGELTEAEAEQVIASMIKQRRDSFEQFTQGNRPELAAKEAAEITLLEEYLPKALSPAELESVVAAAIARFAEGGTRPGPKDMGQVIKAVQAAIQAGGQRAEGRLVSEAVKKQLANG